MIITNETKDLYNEAFKSLRKKFLKDIRKQKDLPCSWVRIKHLKMAIIRKKKESNLYIQMYSKFQNHSSQIQKEKKKPPNLYGRIKDQATDTAGVITKTNTKDL